ncbi:hypothetical protein H4CHR_04229 [Variovorax sp. PBS-H4]|uniref:purine-cytosine permease family protein n=1 Tax=Variovorax sp. PBS-H4 TaxID=434008 RepID=UPI001317989B|nr:hypothetical protein [Variovorax sp. PBS-H4]VTU37668.1 hypothetical protein H4CHR_04229 [Variovorax sp. PBS-H4]
MSSTRELGRLKLGDVLDTRDAVHRVENEGAATEDYSLRRVPATWRWSAWSALWSYSGLSTCMAFPLTAGLLSLYYGAPATLVAFLLTAIYTGFGVYYFTKKSAEEGTLEVLMSRQSFGFIGASYQLIAYGLLGALYFALEGHVMASALTELTGWSHWATAAIVCVVFLPLSIYGMRFLAVFQGATIWLYVLGMLAVLYVAAAGSNPEVNGGLAGGAWWRVNPSNAPLNWVTVLSAFGATSGVLGAILILLCTEQARMARRRESRKAAMLFAGVGTTFGQLVAPLLGIYLLAATGGKIPDPGVSITKLLGGFGLALVVLTQLRINVINVYFGTNALQNFTATATKVGWGRTAYLLPFLVICYGIIVSPWLSKFGTIMTMVSVFLVNWANVMLGEFWLVRRRYGLPAWSEIRRGYLPSYNRIGLLSMWVPTAVGVAMGSGSFGAETAALAVPVTGLAAFFMPLLIAFFMGEAGVVKQYFPRAPVPTSNLPEMALCPIEGVTHHRSDFVQCPFHGNQFISSTACAAERNCKQVCQRAEATVALAGSATHPVTP